MPVQKIKDPKTGQWHEVQDYSKPDVSKEQVDDALAKNLMGNAAGLGSQVQTVATPSIPPPNMSDYAGDIHAYMRDYNIWQQKQAMAKARPTPQASPTPAATKVSDLMGLLTGNPNAISLG